MWIATSDQIRSIERVTQCEFGISSQVLIERAGVAVFDAVRQLLPDGGRIAVFCGKGLNGADGLVTARIANERNYRVEVLMAAEESELCPLTHHQFEILRARGIEAIFPNDERWKKRVESLHAQDLIVDALLGTGASGNAHGYIRQAIQTINRSGVPVVAVDIPSGIEADTGEELGDSVWALRTVTFGMPKPFLFQGVGLEHSGYWTVSEIGMPQQLLQAPTSARLLGSGWVASLLPERLRTSHKGDNGHVLIVAGSKQMRGAAVLAAKAAYASGAGLVTVASIDCVLEAIAQHLPEALLMALPEKDGHIAANAAARLVDSQKAYSSAVFGPGLGNTEDMMTLLKTVWADWHAPSVLDADALNAMAQGIECPKAECVLTPHPGEMSRLLQSSIPEISSDRLNTVRRATDKYSQCMLLKGPYSIVGEQNQPLLVNSTGNSGLASAGMGDVLSGMIGTLLAQDLPGYYSAACAMFWHGAAADVCADEIGSIGYRATDVVNAIPKARVRLVAICD